MKSLSENKKSSNDQNLYDRIKTNNNSKDIIISQILDIRNSGVTNMFDIATVKSVADMLGYNELVNFISKNKSAYSKFIFTGKLPDNINE